MARTTEQILEELGYFVKQCCRLRNGQALHHSTVSRFLLRLHNLEPDEQYAMIAVAARKGIIKLYVMPGEFATAAEETKQCQSPKTESIASPTPRENSLNSAIESDS
jgi:hypothetical protein